MSAGELLLTLANRSIAACWLILAILLFRPFLRKVSPSITCALWGLVAIRLLCPFTVESILSLIPSAEPIPTEVVLSQTHLPAVSPVVEGGGAVMEPAAGTPLPSVSLPAGTPTETTEPLLMRLAVIVWIIGMVAFAAYLSVSYLRLHLRAREAVRQDGGYWLCDKVASPFVLGVFRPRILLPYTADEKDIPYILAHERAHLARRDHWRKPLGFALLAVFWFQPFLWLAYFLLCRDIEFACDERALRTLGTDAQSKKCYAEALLHGASPQRSIIACPVAFGGMQIKGRVRNVLRYKKPALLLTVAALIVCAVLAVCFLPDPVAGTPEGSENALSAPSGTASGVNAKVEDFYPFYGTSVERDLYGSQWQTSRFDDTALLAKMTGEAENAETLSATDPVHIPVFRFDSVAEWQAFRKLYGQFLDYSEFDVFSTYEKEFESHVLLLFYAPNGMAARGMGGAYRCDGKLVQVFRGTGRQAEREPGNLLYYFLPRNELSDYPAGFDAVVYPAGKPVILPDDLSYDPVRRLEEVEGRTYCAFTASFPYLEGVLSGDVDPLAPKLDEATARRIIASYEQKAENYEKIMEEFAAIQPYPDWDGGSGLALAQYWFDDYGDEGLLIDLTSGHIDYYKNAPDGTWGGESLEELFVCRS